MKPPAPKKQTTLYAVYYYSQPPRLESCEVVEWGKGWRSISRSTLAFGCNSRFDADEYAQSPSEAWERYANSLRSSIIALEKTIALNRENITLAEKALRECKTPPPPLNP